MRLFGRSDKDIQELALAVLRGTTGQDAIVETLKNEPAQVLVDQAAIRSLASEKGQASMRLAFTKGEFDKDIEQILLHLRADFLAEVEAVIAAATNRFAELLRQETDRAKRSHDQLIDSVRGEVDGLAQEASVRVSNSFADMTKTFKSSTARLRNQTAHMIATLETMLSNKIDDLMQHHGELLLREAVAKFVHSRPVSGNGLTNRQIAKLHGISLRAVKRLRRAGAI